ncbi:MAG: hypothetical protein JNK67_00585, partial [Alphaproteobacteria bacterium]|nr:hypothetical protein [Alphaproteobacteria bacterium]
MVDLNATTTGVRTDRRIHADPVGDPTVGAELVRETCAALTAAENTLVLEIEGRRTPDINARFAEQKRAREIVRAAIARLPLPTSLLEACKLVADLTEAVDRGLPDEAARRCCERICQTEAAVLQTWPARSFDEVIARLTWLQAIAEDDASEVNHEMLRDVVRITLHDVRRLGGV